MKIAVPAFFLLFVTAIFFGAELQKEKQKVASLESKLSAVEKMLSNARSKIAEYRNNEEVLKRKAARFEDAIVVVTKEDLRTRLDDLKFLSSVQKDEIMSGIEKAYERYAINPLILYSIMETESSFRFWIEHPSVVIKGKKTKAIGLGGIVYEIWGDELKKESIIETKGDLFEIEKNIMSIGYVMNRYMRMPQKRGCDTFLESALRRYYGGNCKIYSERIKKKIADIVFDKVAENMRLNALQPYGQ